MVEHAVVRARVAEWVVECRSSSTVVLAEFRRVLGPAPAAQTDIAPDLVINATVVSASEHPSTNDWTVLDSEDDNASTMWSTPEGIAIAIGRSLAVVTEATASLFFEREEDVQFTLHTLVTVALNHLAMVEDLVPTHSALIGVDGVWLLLLGPSGIGKSTSCLAASTTGLQIASDDTCLLRSTEGRVDAHGLPRAPSLPRVDHGVGDGGPVDYRSRTSEPGFELVDGWHCVNGLLVLEHGAEPLSALAPVSPKTVIDVSTASVAGALSVEIMVNAVPDVLRALLRLPARSLALGADASLRLASTSVALREAAAQI